MAGLKPQRIRHSGKHNTPRSQNNTTTTGSSPSSIAESEFSRSEVSSRSRLLRSIHSHSSEHKPSPPKRSATAVTLPTLSRHYTNIPQLTLNVEKAHFTNVTVKEGSMEFVFWFIVSSYLPVLSACLCPLTNMMSIAALVTSWRFDNDGNYVDDTSLIYALNAVSLGLGCVGNISVILNFGRRLPYKICQSISITAFFSSSAILLTAVILASVREFDKEMYQATEGYWAAVITTVLYFGCGSLSVINFTGALMKKYPPDFNLTTSERGLIIYNFMLAVWFAWGAALFSKLNELSYGDSMYYCTVSLLTIGLGDYVPKSNLSKGLTLAYSLSGIIILGLIIAMIRTMIKSTTSPVIFWNIVEMKRQEVYKKVVSKKIVLTHETAFDLMRSIRKSSKNRERTINSLVSIGIFVLFWLVGALIFHLIEGWSYFNAVYFCFLCLLTIGYGDFHPTTAAGKPAFIVWSLSAVPLMTSLISNIGDSVFHSAMTGVYITEKLKIFQKRFKTLYEEEAEITSNEDIDDQEERSVDEILAEAEDEELLNTESKTTKQTVFEHVRNLITESRNNPNMTYSYQQWHNVIGLLELEDEDIKELGIDSNLFWISDQSPLRFPISEPNYLLFLLFSKMEALITEEAEDIIRETTRTRTRAETSSTGKTSSFEINQTVT